MASNYSGDNYFLINEAGFCRFCMYERLMNLGITNIYGGNPVDVPTMSKEKLRKTNAVNCSKLAHELPFGSFEKELYSGEETTKNTLFIRLRNLIAKDSIHTKNRIKSLLVFMVWKYRECLPDVPLARDIPKIGKFKATNSLRVSCLLELPDMGII
ncbi:hypothetical protein NXX56_02200 [Bacteroides thetaiotaomicron]|nr:hypothetical protein [Bacteroides thetaiotaomicron]